jgi:hypothetical protein
MNETRFGVPGRGRPTLGMGLYQDGDQALYSLHPVPRERDLPN